MSKSTETRYGVARGESLIGPTFSTPEAMHQHHVWASEQARSIGLDPADLRLVTVEVETIVGRPHAYKEPEPEAESVPDFDAPSA